MKIALIGATGFVGAAVLEELLQRGHDVTALARSPEKLSARAGLTAVRSDAQESIDVAAAVRGHDAVISAYNPGWNAPELYAEFLRGHDAIVAGVKQAGVSRFVVVVARAVRMSRRGACSSTRRRFSITCRRTSCPVRRPRAMR